MGNTFEIRRGEHDHEACIALQQTSFSEAGRIRASLRVRAAAAAAGVLLLAGAAPAWAGPAEDIVERLNALRAGPQRCGGRTLPAAPPLVPRPELARAEGGSAAALQRSAAALGFVSARVQLFNVTGARDADEALALLRRDPAACEALALPALSAAGVREQGRRWRIVLAQPLLAPDLGDWREAGQQVLRLANEARSRAQRCGTQAFGAAPPLRWSDTLGAAAQAHSADMARRNYFAHHSPEGAQVNERAQRAGYDWRSIGENIAFGAGSARQVVQGWLDSPGHCRNLMDPGFADMGAAYALNPGSDGAIYWTQVLGRRR
jgi:uncharacterized protein YkwD